MSAAIVDSKTNVTPTTAVATSVQTASNDAKSTQEIFPPPAPFEVICTAAQLEDSVRVKGKYADEYKLRDELRQARRLKFLTLLAEMKEIPIPEAAKIDYERDYPLVEGTLRSGMYYWKVPIQNRYYMVIGDYMYFTRYTFIADQPDHDRDLTIMGSKLRHYCDCSDINVDDAKLDALIAQVKASKTK